MKRRSALKNLSLAALAPLSFPSLASGAPLAANEFKEPSRRISIVKETDVIVCGGGPAGIAAAISAARTGAKTTLIEMYGCLGGIWTAGLLSNLIDYQDKPGIMKEIVDRLEKTNAQHTAKVYDAELMKWVLDQMCMEAGVEIRLHTRITAAYRNSRNRLEHIVTESFSGREAWKAKVFIDTTGNGDLAAYAGCKFDVGHPETGQVQPMSLMAILTGIDEDKLNEAGFMKEKGTTSEPSKGFFYNEIKRAGMEASYTKPTLFGVRPGLVAMMANHEYGVSAMDANQMTQATLAARAEVNGIINGLRGLGGVWSDVRIVATGAQIGVREARRIQGHYTVTSDDLINGARFEDGICRVNFVVDVHSLEKKSGGGYSSHGIKAKPYDIPLRSLIAKDVDGLMMAGRCISGDFFAHASYRVTGNAVAMGEAAGKTAGYAALNDLLPKNVAFRNVFS